MPKTQPKNQPKAQRLLDLVAALIRHNRDGISLSDLPNEVPGYWGEDKNPASVAMMFERDKADLRELGIEIGTVLDATGNLSLYRLDPSTFFLRKLAHGEPTTGAVTGSGTAPHTVSFTSAELSAMVHGTSVLSQLGYSELAEHAQAGLRRLSHDLPIDDFLGNPEVVRGEEGISAEVLARLNEAIERRKRVTFSYHSLDRPAPVARRALPYGLACIEGRWSLFAHDEDANEVRQYRLRRLSDLTMNEKSLSTPDFSVPADFNLWELTQHRYEWELGSGAVEQIGVRFLAETGLTKQAREEGEPHPQLDGVRVYAVRRREPFLRWVLELCGDATIVEPPETADEFAALVTGVVNLYGTPGAH